MRKIFFRADASREIGYGHFIRSLALANMLKSDFECSFHTQCPSQYQIQEAAKTCNLEVLPSTEEKFEIFLNRLEGDEIVVLDNYFYTPDYQKLILDKGCRLVCIDDMHDKHYYADIVINHGTTDESLFEVESHTQLCLGFDWALLRKPFLDKLDNKFQIDKDKPIKNILISFGGSDIEDNTAKTIMKIQNCNQDYSLRAIVGDSYIGQAGVLIKECYRNLNANQMAEALGNSDLVICSASTIGIEALACGCRLIVDCTVDNQKDLYNSFLKTGQALGIDKLGALLQGKQTFRSSGRAINPGISNRYLKLFKSL